MNNYEKLYLLTRLDGIGGLFTAIAAFSFLTILGIFVYEWASSDWDVIYGEEKQKARKEERKKHTNKIKWITLICILFTISSILIPSQKEAIFIIAGGKTIDFIEADSSIQKMPEQTTQIISSFLDKQIKEIEGK
jgi:uncharacterized membrane protein